MGDIFEAIGIKLQDEESYKQLAEAARKYGKRSTISRPNAIIQGYCWSLIEGIEIWSIIYESKDGTYIADCRPALRNSRTLQVNDWEILEFIEDGEALVSGKVQGYDLVFELQNFTELDEYAYQKQILNAHIAGMCYQAKVINSLIPSKITAQANTKNSQTSSYAENDFIVSGQLLTWREMMNPITQRTFFQLELEIGEMRLDLTINESQLEGVLTNNVWVTAEAWLQGFLICEQEQQAKYEGLDFTTPPSQHWLKLRREN